MNKIIDYSGQSRSTIRRQRANLTQFDFSFSIYLIYKFFFLLPDREQMWLSLHPVSYENT